MFHFTKIAESAIDESYIRNEFMAYKLSSGHRIDVQGNVQGTWRSSTYANGGIEFKAFESNGNDITGSLNITGIPRAC